MCEANAYLIEDEGETLVMKAVDTVEPEGEKILLRNIFGEQKLLNARIDSLELVDHKIYLRKTAA